VFFNLAEFEQFGKDYLAVSCEYSERLRQMKYVHSQPDDAFHSLLYAVIFWLMHTGQVATTRYSRQDDEGNDLMLTGSRD